MSEENNESESSLSSAQADFIDSTTARQVELDRVLAEMLQAIEDRRIAVAEQLAEILQDREEVKEEEKEE